MTILHRLASIVRWLIHRDRAERDLSDELEAFVDAAAADHLRAGATPAEARRLAMLHLGGVEQAKERVRTARHGAWLDACARDVQYALRMCARNPGFSTLVVVTLALGIGANTAVFSVVDAVLLRPLTYTEPQRLVVIHETVPGRGRVPVGASEFEEWRRSASAFEQMALMAVAPAILTGAGDPERLDAARVSPSLFPMLGIDAALGRTFTPDEAVLGRHRVVVLSDTLWRTRFGADASIVGRTVTLNDEPYVVSGVLPERFRFPRLEQVFVMGISGNQPQIWMPFAITDAERGENSFAAVAKLKRGVSMDHARAEVSAILGRLAQRASNSPRIDAEVIPLQEQIVGRSRDVLALVWAAITAVLLVASANIANLLLARSAARNHELAIRGALGASRGTLARHSLLDTMTLALMGGVGGVLLAKWSLPFVVGMAPSSVPRLDEVAVDERAIMFTLLITTVTGLAVGMLPARRAAAIDVIEGLRVTARSSTLSLHDRAARGIMVTMQVALTVACLAAAGLVIQSLRNVLLVDAGFETDRTLMVEVSASPGRYGTPDARAEFVRNVLRRLEAVPGVTSVGFVNKPPLSGISMNSVLVLEGTERAALPMIERPLGDIRSVNAEYFRTLGISLLDGQLFQEVDARPVAIVSERMANRAWPGERAIGKRFRLSARPRSLVEVIGVVRDAHQMGLDTAPSSTVYLPYWQGFLNATSFAVKTGIDPSAAVSAVRAAISEVDRDVPIDSVRTMQGVVSESVATRTFQATLLTLFGVVALALSAIGVFGVVSYSVAQRSKELGIRLALGATPRSLQRMVVGDVLRLVGTGVLLGAPLAVWAGAVLRDVLFGVRPQDPRVLVAAAVLMILVAIVGGSIPAIRATRMDPLATLRAE